MGGINHRIWLLSGAFLLAGCIPATDAPAPVSRPARGDPPPREEVVRGDIFGGEVIGGDAKPTWALKPVTTNAVPVAAGNYIVRPGDTLRAIGEMSGAGSEALAIENDLTVPYMLRPGQALRIPAGLYHRVAAGETGIGIAAAYAADWGEIITVNALSEPYILRVGQRLRHLEQALRAFVCRSFDWRIRAGAVPTGRHWGGLGETEEAPSLVCNVAEVHEPAGLPHKIEEITVL